MVSLATLAPARSALCRQMAVSCLLSDTTLRWGDDIVVWTADVEVNEVSDTAMADYETDKVQYEYTTEFDLHTAGSTWFKVTSKAEYGYGRSLPGGQYRAIVMAECIAN